MEVVIRNQEVNINKKSEVTTPKRQNSAKLIKAITSGDIAEARQLISEMNSEEINAVNEAGSTALHYATFERQPEVCELIISMSLEAVNIADGDGFTALHYAAYRGYKEICELLTPKMSLEAINAPSWSNWTALHLAAKEGHKKVCELLIPEANLCTINVDDTDGNTALQLASEGGHQEVCEMLIPKMSYETINATDEVGSTALHYAAFGGYNKVCELLLNNMNLEATNTTDKNGNTALHLAAEGEYKETCKVLIGNMHVKKVAVLLKQSSNDSLIQKVTGEIVADFMNDKFSGSEINLSNFSDYQVKLLKLYQVVDHSLLNSYLIEQRGNNLCINSTDNYITEHYFILIGVCKFISEDSPISILVSSNDCMSCMLPYLGLQNLLLPELFPLIELSGESVVVSSENEEEGWCTLA